MTPVGAGRDPLYKPRFENEKAHIVCFMSYVFGLCIKKASTSPPPLLTP